MERKLVYSTFIAIILLSSSVTFMIPPASAMTVDELCDPNQPGAIVAAPGKKTVRGTNGDDIIIGNELDNIIIGKKGADILCGGDGNDRLHGGNQNDILLGQAGSDKFHGGHGIDTCDISTQDTNERNCELEFGKQDANGDSFFDVFFSIFTVDSFFDILFPLQDFAQRTTEGDTFFDVFTETSIHNQDIGQIQNELSELETRIIALEQGMPPAQCQVNADCDLPNVTVALCSANQCEIVQCDAGFVDVDQVTSNGCEQQFTPTGGVCSVEELTTIGNCAAQCTGDMTCLLQCVSDAVPPISNECTSGFVQLGVCASNAAQQDPQCLDGLNNLEPSQCIIDNCSAEWENVFGEPPVLEMCQVDADCNSEQNSSAVCTAQGCSYSCDAGFEDTNGNLGQGLDGCETDLTNIGSIQVSIVDEVGNPVENTQISLESDPPVLTDAFGMVTFSNVVPGVYQLSIAHDSCIPDNEFLQVEANSGIITEVFETLTCVVPVDFNGMYSMSQGVNYQCAFGNVNLSFDSLTVTQNNDQMTVVPTPTFHPNSMSGTATDNDFSVSSTVQGGCVETYTITASSINENNFNGLFSATYVGPDCSVLGLDPCFDQSISFIATKP